MSNTTNHQSTSELSWLFGRRKKSLARQTARIRQQPNKSTAILVVMARSILRR